MRILKNYSWNNLSKDPIEIREDSPDWDTAYNKWISGKNPSNDPRWKEGVFMSVVKDSKDEDSSND